MTDLAIVRWIRDLDENGAVALARSLIFAEAGRHGLPLDQFTMSGRVKARDQGIDGRTHFPDAEGIVLPTGRNVWQIKSGGSVPSANDEFDPDKHGALLQAIRDGYDYVLFWTNDPVDPTLTTVKNNFTTAAQAVRADVKVTFLFAEAIESVCYAHLGVLVQQSPFPLAGVVGLEVWAPEEFGAVAFQPDPDRVAFIEALRAHVASEEPPAEVHVFGDTGVGKSRLVFEALAVDGIGPRVLVVPDASQWDAGLLALVAQSPDRSLIAVIDDCDGDDRRSLARYAGMARGRIRLITIGSRSSRERPVEDSRYMELLPLEAAASREIALSVGLSERDADVVAEYTEGYPGLALTLAKAIRYGAAGDSLIERVRRHEEIGQVFSSLLPEADVVPLGMLALFEKIGFEGDLAQELTLACEILGVDEPNLREVTERELKRFVSTAGRFRRVTPRLFAVWLASQFMHDRRETLTRALTDLPESLRDRIVTQMRDFAGDPVVADTLGDILGRDPFRSGALGDVDEGAARLLHVAAIAAPEAAMDAIERVLVGIDPERLRSFGAGRREMVWALEVLLWFDHLFDRAADALLRLAIAENETWSNNASGVLQGLFRVYLGGTGAPYERRLRWARQALAEYGVSALPLIIEGLGHALDVHESRTSTHFGGRTAPEEWRPKLVVEEMEARGGAWDLLIEIARAESSQSFAVAKAIARGLRTALRRGMSDRVLTDLREVSWTPAARGSLGDALAKALRYDTPPDELAEQLRELEAEIRGRSLTEQLDYVFSLSPWQLETEDEEALSGRPRILRQLAADLVGSPREVVLDAAARSRDGDAQTTGVLFEELAMASNDPQLLEDLEALDPTPDAAILGALKGLAASRDGRWSDDVVERWLSGTLARLVVAAVHLLPTSDHRLHLAVTAVDRGAVGPSELGRLLYGAWARPLDAGSMVELLVRLRASNTPYDIESALGILEQWLEMDSRGNVPPELRSIAVDLVGRANELSDRSSAMLGLYRARVINGLGLSFEERLPVVTDLLRQMDSFPDSYDLEVLDSLTEENPEATIAAVLDLILDDNGESFQPSLMWLEDAKLLSRLGRATAPGLLVEEVVRRVDEPTWPSLIGHIDFSSEEPDPLLVALLGRSATDVLRGRAAFRFMYPQTAWTGPESSHLRAAREKAARWRGIPDIPERFREWLDEVVGLIDDRVESAERDEAERGY